jgi:putative ABC transport system permease protein
VLRATLKSLLARKVRLLLTGLAVVLGVSFVSGTYVLSDTITATFDTLFREVNAGVDLAVRRTTGFDSDTGQGEEREVLPVSLVERIRGVPGVAQAVGDVTGYAQLVAPDGTAVTTTGAPTLGVVYQEGQLGGALTVAQGRAPRAGELAIDRRSFTEHRFTLGSRVTVLTLDEPVQLTLVGVVRFGSTDSLAGATLAVFDLPTALDVLGKDGYDAITVRVTNPAEVEDVRRRIADVVPERTEILTGSEVAEEDSEGVGEILSIIERVLLVFAFVALFVGGFIIVNTFTILVAQRTRELALLRALGASRGQVLRSVVVEALIVGVLSSTAGLLLGILVAKGLQGAFRAFGVDLPAGGTVLRGRTVVAAYLVGILVTLVASVLPARRAASVPPVAAMRDDLWVPVAAGLRRRAIAGGTLLVLGAAALAAGLFGSTGSGLQLVGLGALLVFLGVAVVSPLVATPLARTIGAPFARWRGVPGRLGRENAMRNPRRTASTSAALMIGLALVGVVSVLAESVKASAGKVVDSSLGADFTVSTENFFTGHSPVVAQRLRALPEIGTVAEARTGPFQVDGRDRFLTGMDPATVPEVVRLRLESGSLDALNRGQLLVSVDVASELGVGLGDRVPVEFGRTGKEQLTVGGVFGRNQLVGGYLLSVAAFDERFAQRLNAVTLANAAPGVAPAAAGEAVRRALEEFPNLVARDATELKEFNREQVNQLLGLIFALLALAILIALVGIVNTLALSVYERVREIGLLRAVGMDRRQVRRMVRYEAVVIAVLGALLGLGLGLVLGVALVTALEEEGITTLAVPGGQLAVYVVLAALAGVVAAVLPARRAARLDVLDAIAHS